MASFIAFCQNDNCGAIFEVPSFVGGPGKITIGFEDVKVISNCPFCSSEATIPSGIYEYANNALIKFTGSETSVEILLQVQKILKNAKLKESSKKEILEEVEAISPETAETFKNAPKTSNFLQWIGTLTAIVALAIQIHSTYVEDDNVEQQFREHLLQENKELQKKNKVKPFKRNKPKIQRNSPCPCKSGKKYKKCCGLIRV